MTSPYSPEVAETPWSPPSQSQNDASTSPSEQQTSIPDRQLLEENPWSNEDDRASTSEDVTPPTGRMEIEPVAALEISNAAQSTLTSDPASPSHSTESTSPSKNRIPPNLTTSTKPTVDISEFDPFASTDVTSKALTPSSSSPKSRTTTTTTTTTVNQAIAAHRDSRNPPSIVVHTTQAQSPPISTHRSPSSTDHQQSSFKPSSSDAAPAVPSPIHTTSSLPTSPTAPTFDFQGFLTDLRGKGAEGIARYLKSFLTNFAKRPFTVSEQIKLIHDFLEFIAGKMRMVEPWRTQSPAEFDNAMEAMEKLVMNRLYTYTFTPQINPAVTTITTDDLERDAVLSQRIQLFGWIRAKHLDVPEGEASQGFLAFAEQELLKVNHYKAPRDKMICILNCCKVIFGLLRHVAGTEGTSADSFLPILIYVILRANPPNLLSNVEYIQRFRTADKLQGEAGYYLSSLGGAIHFIETMDASQLSNITQEEFELNVEQAISELPQASPHDAKPLPRAPAGRPVSAPGSNLQNTVEGEEPARALTNLPANIALESRRLFQRTGELASGAVGRPLSALGRLIDGIATGTNSDAEESEDGGDGDERHRDAGRTVAFQPNVRSPQPQAQHGATGSYGASLAPGLPGPPYDGSAAPSRTSTPGENDPTFNFSALTAEIDRTHLAARQASIETLNQMFPAIDEEVAGVVLDSCGGDLGLAIDRMLEMAAG